jgi:hypothetical protein
MPPAKKYLTRHEAGQQAAYYCPGCHAKERGLAHGVHCPENGGQAPEAAPVPAGAWDDLDDEEEDSIRGEDVAMWVDWNREGEERTERYKAALAAGCTDLQATTMVQLGAGIPARAIARHRGCDHTAVLRIRRRGMAHSLASTDTPTPVRGDSWGAPTTTGLTSRQRYVMSMRDWHGHTLTYIAANMGITRQAVWALYQRGLKWAKQGEIRGGARPSPRAWKQSRGSGRLGHHVD